MITPHEVRQTLRMIGYEHHSYDELIDMGAVLDYEAVDTWAPLPAVKITLRIGQDTLHERTVPKLFDTQPGRRAWWSCV